MLKKYVSSLLILPLIVINICFSANSQSLYKVEIGNHADSLKDLELDLIATDEIGGYSIRKFRLNNGNYLSVTYETSSQRIVFIEADSSRNSIEKSNFRDFSYGLTTLAEIRQELGSNGCAYHNNGIIETPRGIAFINAYQIRNNSEIMGVFISHLNSSDFQVVQKNPDKIADFATLDSIILSEENYLNKIWGQQQGCDPNYEPINWYSDRSLHTEALINPSWREVPSTATPENSQSGSLYSDPAYINENS